MEQPATHIPALRSADDLIFLGKRYTKCAYEDTWTRWSGSYYLQFDRVQNGWRCIVDNSDLHISGAGVGASVHSAHKAALADFRAHLEHIYTSAANSFTQET